MWEELSENAEKLLGRLVILGEGRPKGEVKDEDLMKAAELDYDAGFEAVKELVEAGLAASDDSDYYFLRATSAGKERIRGL